MLHATVTRIPASRRSPQRPPTPVGTSLSNKPNNSVGRWVALPGGPLTSRGVPVMRMLAGLLVVGGLGAVAYSLELIPERVRDFAQTHAAQYLPESFLNSQRSTFPSTSLRRFVGGIATTRTASGALSAITTVLVSSQVSGQMLRILADYTQGGCHRRNRSAQLLRSLWNKRKANWPSPRRPC
jgi:hypothetical protein